MIWVLPPRRGSLGDRGEDPVPAAYDARSVRGPAPADQRRAPGVPHRASGGHRTRVGWQCRTPAVPPGRPAALPRPRSPRHRARTTRDVQTPTHPLPDPRPARAPAAPAGPSCRTSASATTSASIASTICGLAERSSFTVSTASCVRGKGSSRFHLESSYLAPRRHR